MDKRTLWLGSVILVNLSFSQLFGAAVEISRIWPNKLLYKQKEDVQIEVKVKNDTDTQQSINLSVYLIKELDNSEKIIEQNITLSGLEEKRVEVTWNAGDNEYGFECKAVIKDKEKKIIDEKSEYFMVCNNAWRVGQTFDFHDTFILEEYYLKEVIPELRKNYLSVWEYFSPWPCNFSDLTPETEEWFSGQNGYHESKSAFKKIVEECHRNGIAVVVYVNNGISGLSGTEFLRQHPEWATFGEDGQLSIWAVESKNIELLRRYYQKLKRGEKDKEFYQMREELEKVKETWQVGAMFGILLSPVNTLDLNTVKHATDEIIKSAKEFGYDGVRFDGEYLVGAGVDPLKGETLTFNYRGESLKKDYAEADRISLRNMQYFKKRVKKELPDFIFGYNYGMWYKGNLCGELLPNTFKECANDGMKLLEVINQSHLPTSTTHLWEKFREKVIEEREYTRQAKGYFYMGFFWGGSPSPIYWKHLMAITFASNSHLAADYHEKRPYYQFVTRYSGFLYDPKIEWVKEKVEEKVKIFSERPIWWKEYLYEKKTDKNLYTILHLLNPPASPEVLKEMNLPPPLQKDIVAKITIPKGYQPEKVYLLSPDIKPISLPLKFKEDKGWIEIEVPTLEYWDIVVTEWGEK
jgi:hypothetical protein